MGRYFFGDIDGKFWFGVQSSSAADRFGVNGMEPNYLEYFFSEEDLPAVTEELKKIRNGLGKYYKEIQKFFKTKPTYTFEELATALDVSSDKAVKLLSEYADYSLGAKIWFCIRKNGQCSFDAEC